MLVHRYLFEKTSIISCSQIAYLERVQYALLLLCALMHQQMQMMRRDHYLSLLRTSQQALKPAIGEGAYLGAKGREKEGGKSGSEATAEVPSVLDSIQKGEFETWKRKEQRIL
jgi:hypothetical protein